MSKRKIKQGSTSVVVPVYIDDTSSPTGAGLTGLAYNTSGLVARYKRSDQSSWTTLTLASATAGTWTSSGFVEAGRGVYELGLPNAALSAGTWVIVQLYGATNMGDVNLEIELDQVDYQDAAGAGLSRLDAAVSSRLAAASYSPPDNSSIASILENTETDLPAQLTAVLARLPALALEEWEVSTTGFSPTLNQFEILDTTGEPAQYLNRIIQITSGDYAGQLLFVANVALGSPGHLLVTVWPGLGALADGDTIRVLGFAPISLSGLADTPVSICTDAAELIGNPGLGVTLTSLITSVLGRLGAPAGASMSADIAAVKSDTAAILEDTGSSGVVVATHSKSGYSLSSSGNNATAAALLATALGASQSDGTVGHALQLARAQAGGKWVISGDTLTIYDTDGTTEVATFTLAPTGGPYTSRASA